MNNFTAVNNMPFWEDLSILQVNTLPARSYLLPFPSAESNCGNVLAKCSKERCICLNGIWQFHYYQDVAMVDDYLAILNEKLWDDISVPSCWQFKGYEKPYYVNSAFPFPATPPFVPSVNPIGVYKRKFNINKQSVCRAILSLQGVCSAFDLYVNDIYIGYSQGSHMPAEFDVIEALRDGENQIYVVVFKWCDGSYLECQDMLRNNGIFRDVFLLLYKQNGVFDIVLNMSKSENGYLADFDVVLNNDSSCKIKTSIAFKGESVFSEAVSQQNGRAHFKTLIKNPREWSAEIPNLYKLSVSVYVSDMECENVSINIGLKDVQIVDGVFLVNGQPIKCKGVNHHDVDALCGSATSAADNERDILLMKELNINTVRFSHYPPASEMLGLCDIYGLYVVDEADIECHGAYYMDETFDFFAKSPQWKDSFVNRVARMYWRDKNHASIILWSLGNESGFGENHVACYDYLKAQNKNLKVHYEGAWESENEHGFDIVSCMYSDVKSMRRMMKKTMPSKPFFLCEYAHAMGVGPGGLKEYWQEIYKQKKSMGGCIWEFCDHAYTLNGNQNQFCYGGDGGEYIHDGNFCADGMLTSLRELEPSAYEIKNVYRPIRSTYKNGLLKFINTNSFINASDYDIVLEHVLDGVVIKTERSEIRLKPLKSRSNYVKLLQEKGEYFLNIIYRFADKEVGREQHIVREISPIYMIKSVAPIIMQDEQSMLHFTVGNHKIAFNKRTATISSYRIFESDIISGSPHNSGYNQPGGAVAGFLVNIYRHNIDNDVPMQAEWHRHGYDMMWTKIKNFFVEKTAEGISITVNAMLSPPKWSAKFTTQIIYLIQPDGSIKVTAKLKSENDKLPFLPRFGLRVELDKAFNLVNWYGYGERESYCDFIESAIFGKYEKKIDELGFDYVKPQENGNRSGVRYVSFSGKDDVELTIFANGKPLSFNAHHFVSEQYNKALHIEDITKTDTTELLIDGSYSGVGSCICGPSLPDEYRVNSAYQEFCFVMRAEKIQNNNKINIKKQGDES